jgi:3-hydroxyisobutyrate dehydrogenase
MLEVINVSTGRNFMSEVVMQEHVVNGKFATGFALGLLAKDVGIAADLASDIGCDAPLMKFISKRWAEARDAMGGECDNSEAARLWDK